MSSRAKQLVDKYGPFVSGPDLRKLLGYRSADAFRHAVARQTLPVRTFREKGRRERLARTQDVADWLTLMDQRLAAPECCSSTPDGALTDSDDPPGTATEKEGAMTLTPTQ